MTGQCPACRLTEDQVRKLVTEQDLRNAVGSALEFAAEAFRVNEPNTARTYLRQVAKDIITGKGHPAPNPNPVTPEA